MDLKPEQIIPNTEFFYANGSGWLEQARRTVALSYLDTLRPEMNQERIYEQLCTDGYEKDARSKTFVAVTTNPLTHVAEVSATLRLVLGKEIAGSHLPSIDALALIDAPWPHRQQGLSDIQIAELGRFAVDAKYRTLAMHKGGAVVNLTGGLVRLALQTAEQEHKPFVYAIMPSYVSNLVQKSGIPITRVEGMRLREEDSEARAIFDGFPNYWRPDKRNIEKGPKLYTFTMTK